MYEDSSGPQFVDPKNWPGCGCTIKSKLFDTKLKSAICCRWLLPENPKSCGLTILPVADSHNSRVAKMSWWSKIHIPFNHPLESVINGSRGMDTNSPNVGDYNENHSPVITIIIGGMNLTIPSHGCFMALFHAHKLWYLLVLLFIGFTVCT